MFSRKQVMSEISPTFHVYMHVGEWEVWVRERFP